MLKGIWAFKPERQFKLKGIISQEELVSKEIKENRQISRNWALDNEIMHVAAIIKNLKKKGMKIEGKLTSNDYIYSLI